MDEPTEIRLDKERTVALYIGSVIVAKLRDVPEGQWIDVQALFSLAKARGELMVSDPPEVTWQPGPALKWPGEGEYGS